MLILLISKGFINLVLNKTLITTSKQNYSGKNFIFLNNWLTNNYFLEIKKR